MLHIFIISFILVSDLFIQKGQPVTFDGPTHLANIAMFFKSLAGGEYRAAWTDGFANYGMPIGLMAQQTTSYLGAFMNFAVHNVLLSYNLVFFIGAFLSSLFFYLFLRIYFRPESAFLGAFLFNFAPYRIINVYIRGALPEFFASVFLPLLLIGIYWLTHKDRLKGFVLIVISSAFIMLTHPMMMVIYAFIYVPYAVWNIVGKRYILRLAVISASGLFLGIGIAGYFIVPLSLNMKFFYYGLSKNHFLPEQFMTMKNFFDPNWYYFFRGDVFPRGHFIQSGLLETIILIIGGFYLLYAGLRRIKKFRSTQDNLLIFSVLISAILIFFMSRYGSFLYKNINFLGNTQHQWRLFSSFIFLPPIIFAYLIEQYSTHFRGGAKIFIFILIFTISFLRFPQLYGKNYTLYPDSSYFFTVENLHGNILNTVWTSATRDYPVKTNKTDIIEGKGEIKKQVIKNSKRTYKIDAQTDVRMADYTFYFPGWNVYIDGKAATIQFQDPAYRGVITYMVPKGQHTVEVVFKETKTTLFGYGVSLISLVIFFGPIYRRKWFEL